MISIFDDAGVRQSITWQGIELNDPDATAKNGFTTDAVAFNTPTNFASEAIDDIVKQGGGLEYYNPRVGTRVLTMNGHVHAVSESELNELMYPLQRAFHPLYLQSLLAANRAGTATWPPPNGLPSWVTSQPLSFTRVMTRDWAPASFSTGKMALYYYVVPLELPDPVRSTTRTGVGAEWQASWLIMFGGRSFDRTEQNLVGAGNIVPTWGKAPIWPIIRLAMAGAGASNFTITTTGHHMATALVLDLTTVGASTIDIDCGNRKIWSNFIYDGTGVYGSGDYPVIHPTSTTAVAYANATNVTSATVYYRESDYV
jgi:hypothetical protein